ncbi:MAG: hypothetical protein FWF96_04745 [Kiritimatiellaeota bacterium]|nr:hypothetical protein [Kiritimatiellota bacterium]
MRKWVCAAMVALGALARADESDLSRWHASLSPGVAGFGRHSDARRAGYGALRLGYLYDRARTLEAGVFAAPSVRAGAGEWGGGQAYGVFADALTHWDRYARWCDAYLLTGAGVLGSDRPVFAGGRAAFAPRLGVGVMSHPLERLTLRVDVFAQGFAGRGLDIAPAVEAGLAWHF